MILNSPAPPSLDFLKPLTCLGGIYMSKKLSQKCKAAMTVAGLTLVPWTTGQ